MTPAPAPSSTEAGSSVAASATAGVAGGSAAKIVR